MHALQAALQECLQHMQTQYWQPAVPSSGAPVPHIPSQPLFVASRRAAEARVKAGANADATVRQPRRSARLQHCQAADLAAPTPVAAAPHVATGISTIARLASEDDFSVGSLASSHSNYCGSPQKGLLRELSPSSGA